MALVQNKKYIEWEVKRKKNWKVENGVLMVLEVARFMVQNGIRGEKKIEINKHKKEMPQVRKLKKCFSTHKT